MTHEDIAKALVRPLVWEDGRAETPFGRLLISIHHDHASRGGLDYRAGDYVKAAQGDEEADYRARISAALDIEKVAKLVEALTVERDYWAKKAEADWRLMDAADNAADYPLPRKMTEAMRKVDGLAKTLAAFRVQP